MIEKRILVSDRVRHPPDEGFSWIDRRFLREFSPRLSHEAIALYFLLAAVSDKHGLSFYREASIAAHLRMREKSVVTARDELIRYDLVAYQVPLTQVLSLPQRGRVERAGLHGVAELFRHLKDEGNRR